ncbi:MAG: mechanosensitive ion channel [Pseudanabaenaceae cyanobacterium]
MVIAQLDTTQIFDFSNPNNPVLKTMLSVGIILIGWVVAVVLSSLTTNLLNRTDIDNKLAGMIAPRDGTKLPIEKWIGTLVFWIIFLFALGVLFNYLQLSDAAAPINDFLKQLTSFIPKLIGAAFLAFLGWLLATVARVVAKATLQTTGLDRQVSNQLATADNQEQPQLPISNTVAEALYWFVLLLFLPLILDALELQQALQPLQNLVNQFLLAIPKIIKAVIIGGAGFLIALFVRRLVTNLLTNAGADRLLSQMPQPVSLAQAGGMTVFVLILIPSVIATLEALEIDALARPATQMLDQVLRFIPLLFAGGLVLTIAYVVGQFVRQLLSNLLASFGFDNLWQWLGFAPASDDSKVIISPSQMVGTIVLVAIMLVATVTATDIMQIAALTRILLGLMEIAGRVLVAVIILGGGLFLGNLSHNLIAGGGGRQMRILGNAARIAVVSLVGAMALQQLGIAGNIVDLVIGLIAGGVAVAIALAFGLGGREVAAEELRRWLENWRKEE